MGRQYNYYISPDEELKFAKYIFDNGFTIIAPNVVQEDNNIVLDWSVDTIQMYTNLEEYEKVHSFLWRTYLYKKEWGELKITPEKCIDRMISPIIEHMHCNVNIEKNRLSRGRFYLRTYYKDEVESFDTIYKEYQKLVRAIKKEMKYKNYKFEDGDEFFFPSSQAAVDLISSGCKISF